ncbi:MAG: SprT family zinc-dependent metalloprotease [Pseudomonadota bacterium]
MALTTPPEILTVGAPPVAVTLRRNVRARRLTLRVSSVDGTVTLTLPPGVPVGEARRFLEARTGWLTAARARAPEAVEVRAGATLPVEGRPLRLELAEVLRPVRDGDRLLLRGPAARVGRQAEAWLREAARARLEAAARAYAGRLGRQPARVTLRDPRSRWGSCTAEGRLMFSWRLILAPPEILDYVAAHEAAHLVEMNHGPRFWALVAELFPDHRAARGWLRSEGPALHRYRF